MLVKDNLWQQICHSVTPLYNKWTKCFRRSNKSNLISLPGREFSSLNFHSYSCNHLILQTMTFRIWIKQLIKIRCFRFTAVSEYFSVTNIVLPAFRLESDNSREMSTGGDARQASWIASQRRRRHRAGYVKVLPDTDIVSQKNLSSNVSWAKLQHTWIKWRGKRNGRIC